MPAWKTAEAIELLEDLGMPYEDVEVLTARQLGTSPGDVMWTGEALRVEAGCQEWMVFHEAAHHVVCQGLHPKHLRRRNWGFAYFGPSRSLEMELLAAKLTLFLLIAYDRPFVEAMIEMSLDPYRSFYRRDRHSPPDQRTDESNAFEREFMEGFWGEVGAFWCAYEDLVRAEGREPKPPWRGHA